MADRVGQQLGNYRLVRKLGEGGFAEAYLGEHVHLGTQAAIKVLKTGLASQQEIDQFRIEARTIANLVHPHIVRVLEFDIVQGTPFLVMDYAPHGSLVQHHPKGTRLPLATVVAYVKQVAEALQFAHDQRLIHRDIKPENLLLGRNNEVLLSDFGIVVVAQSTSRSQTQGFAGTAAYSAPEQLLGKPHQASDQYALGIVVYEWLCGELPFQGAPIEVAFMHAQAPVPPFGKVLNLPPMMEQVVRTALAKDPNGRFANVRAFANALEQASQTAVTVPVVGVAPAPTALPLSGLLPPTTPVANPPIGTVGQPAGVPTVPGSPSGGPLPPVGRAALTASGGPPRGTTLVVHDSPGVSAIAWSPNGQRVASGNKGWDGKMDERIEVWDAITGKILIKQQSRLETHTIVWSPDGEYIVPVSRGCVWVWKWGAKRKFWDRESELEVGTLLTTSYYAPGIILWSGDLSSVAVVCSAVGLSDSLVFSSLRGRKPTVQISISEKSCNGGVVAWSPDNTRIAWGAGNEVPVWRVNSSEQEGRHLLTYREHHSPIVAVGWSPDGRQITSRSEDGSEQVWDAGTAQRVAMSTGPAEKIKKLVPLMETIKARSAISPDGTLKAVPTNDGLELQTVAGGATVFVYQGHFSDKTAQHWSPEVKALAWSPDGSRIAFARFDGKIYVWQAV